MAITAMSLTNGTLTVILDGGSQILTARNDHPRWTELIEAYKAENEQLIRDLVSIKSVVETYSVGALSINSTGVTYNGNPLHTVDADRVLAFVRDGLPYKPIANYIARKLTNPSARAIKEMYAFLEHKGMPLTSQGTFIAYKGVDNNYWSIKGNTETVVKQGKVDGEGRILNEVGAIIEVERSSVDDDFRQGCSFGLHAGSLEYAKGWGRRVVLVEIDPADVVSVPEDCSCQKLRCCKYKVIGEYTGPMPDHYTEEFDSTSEECSNCGDPDCDGSCEYDSCSCGSSDCPDCGWVPSDLQPMTNSAEDEQEAKANAPLESPGCSVALTDVCGCGKPKIHDLDLCPDCLLPDKNEQQCACGRAECVDCNPNDNEQAYLDGMKAGNNDRVNEADPQYVLNDQNGADSPAHARYIEGYVDGYSS